MIDPAIFGFQPRFNFSKEELIRELTKPTDKRVFAIAQALHEESMTVDEIHKCSNIDHWFIRRCENIVKCWKSVEKTKLDSLDEELLHYSKKLGYSDIQLAQCLKLPRDSGSDSVRAKRIELKVTPNVKQIDTLAAEFPAETNYLYMTYHGTDDDVGGDDGSVIVLGSGAYRIGSSIEFDWCGVSSIRALRDMGYKSTMINYNPETVSTDYDECDKLYFEELSKERILDIYHRDSAKGVIISVGGQIPNNLALPLDKANINILGTTAAMIDNAEDRNKFSAALDEIGVQQPAWEHMTSMESAFQVSEEVMSEEVMSEEAMREEAMSEASHAKG